MRWPLPKLGPVLIAAAAIAGGVVLAYLTSTPAPEPDVVEPAGVLNADAAESAPRPHAGTDTHQSGRNVAPATAPPPNGSPPATSPAPQVRAGADGANDPAPLPAFFDNAFGPPERDEAGALVEGTPHELQARLDQEARDDAWADKVEWQLENFLALQPLGERVEASNVLCRTSVCRVVATAERSALPTASEGGWEEMMATLRYESVSNEFSGSTDLIVFNASEPNRVGFVTYFEREAPPTRSVR